MNTPPDSYVDGFVIPIHKSKLDTYRNAAAKSAALWREHGALDVRECVLEDPRSHGMRSFIDFTGVQEDETVIFAYIVYRSREHRDEVNAKVMADPRLHEICPGESPTHALFDCSRSAYGGFQIIVS